jgi:hypothetical protein
MYLLTIRDGLHTRHIGPYASPSQAADQLDMLLDQCGERAHWQIHELEAPPGRVFLSEGSSTDQPRNGSGLAAA